MTCSRGCVPGHNRQVEVCGSGPGERRGKGHADTGAAADLVNAAVAELYGGEPGVFTGRRTALASAAKAAGDASAAAAIAALRKPTRAAWIVNRLSRTDPGAPSRLAALATALRDAERAKDGPRLRELSATRGPLIDALTAQALAAADVRDPPPSLRDEITSTLTAALADPSTAAGFASGTLTRAAHWSGFGAFDLTPTGEAPQDQAMSPADTAEPDISPATARPSATARSPAVVRSPTTARSPTTVQAGADRSIRPPRTHPPEGGAPRPRRAASGSSDEMAARIAAESARRQVLEAAERADRDREKYEDAERTVASAATAAAGAAAEEDRLEAEVRDLEQRLIRARADLASARLLARRTEAAERRARQSLDRLSPPLGHGSRTRAGVIGERTEQ
jgi:hypothetical protein